MFIGLEMKELEKKRKAEIRSALGDIAPLEKTEECYEKRLRI